MNTYSLNVEQALIGPITEPQYLVYIELDQPYYWSTRAAVTADGHDWSPAGVQVKSVSGSRAVLMVENDSYRHAENAMSGAYQRGAVRIYMAYPLPDDDYVEDGYWDDDYVSRETEPVLDLQFTGIVDVSTPVDYWLSVEAHRTPPRMFPFQRIRPPFANHLPAEGYMITFDGQVLRVEGSR